MTSTTSSGKEYIPKCVPRYALEALGMILIAALGYALVLEQGSSNNIIPLLGALALGAQRLLHTTTNL